MRTKVNQMSKASLPHASKKHRQAVGAVWSDKPDTIRVVSTHIHSSISLSPIPVSWVAQRCSDRVRFMRWYDTSKRFSHLMVFPSSHLFLVAFYGFLSSFSSFFLWGHGSDLSQIILEFCSVFFETSQVRMNPAWLWSTCWRFVWLWTEKRLSLSFLSTCFSGFLSSVWETILR